MKTRKNFTKNKNSKVNNKKQNKRHSTKNKKYNACQSSFIKDDCLNFN